LEAQPGYALLQMHLRGDSNGDDRAIVADTEGSNLEFNDAFQVVNSSQVKRGGYAKLTWRF
jgi:hypothetical protein